MFKSVEEAFEEYRDYFIKLIDGLIVSHENLFQYVLTNDDTDIETRAKYKSHIEEAHFAKKMFMAAVNEGIPTIDEVYIERYSASNNYLVIILSSLLCSLFLIFLQMKKKEDNDR